MARRSGRTAAVGGGAALCPVASPPTAPIGRCRPVRRTLIGRLGHGRVGRPSRSPGIVLGASFISVRPVAPRRRRRPDGDGTGADRVSRPRHRRRPAIGTVRRARQFRPTPSARPRSARSELRPPARGRSPGRHRQLRRRGPVPRRTARCSSPSRSTRPSPTAATSSDLQGQGRRHAGRHRQPYGVSMMTLWWANKLKSKDDLHQRPVLDPAGQRPRRQVKAGDTLASLARQYKVTEAKIIDDQRHRGPEPRRRPGARRARRQGRRRSRRPSRQARPSRRAVRGRQRRAAAAPAAAQDLQRRRLRVAVAGGNNYISQYYHYGHYGLDIAADYGRASAPPRAAR